MKVKNEVLDNWINEMAMMCNPDRIVWVSGSQEEKEKLEKEALNTGEMFLLNQEKLPGCLLHRTAINDVARKKSDFYLQRK